MHLHQIVFYALLIVAVALALWRGGQPERAAAAIYVAGAVLSPLVQVQGIINFRTTEWGVFAVDLAMLGLLLWLALVSSRFWPMLAVALHGVAMVAHAAAPLARHGSALAYARTEIAPSYLMILLLAVCVWRHQRRLRRYGIDPSWTRDLPKRYLRGMRADELREEDRCIAGKDTGRSGARHR